MTKSRNLLAKRKHWTPIELDLLRVNYASTLTRDIAQALGCSQSAVYQKAHQLGLFKAPEFVAEMARKAMENPDHGGRKFLLKKGNVPANKGMKHSKGWAPGRMASTQFKKGTMPHTWLPVGSYRINSGAGGLEYKFSDEPGPYTKRWVPVHRKVWIEANGPVPEGHAVVFKPGRKTTDPTLITLDAVECITRRELMARNTVQNLPKELAELVQLRGALNRQINRKAAAA